MLKQCTLNKAISVTGIGLHSGKKVSVNFKPAPKNTGLVYRRTDLEPNVEFKCTADAVRDTQLCTALVNDAGVRISTIEHLQAALFALGIDNLFIEVNAPEVPIMDGSAYPFVYLLSQVGVKQLSAPKQFIKVTKPVRVEDGEKWAMVEPSSKGLQMDLNYRVLNNDGLRYEDEFVKHKLLDCIGDLYMSNKVLLGKFSAYKTGHHLNNQMIRELLAHPECYEIKTFNDEELSNVFGTPIDFIHSVAVNA